MENEVDVQDVSIVKASAETKLSIERDPERVLAEAHKAALALKGVIDAKPKKVIFNNKVYLEYEDWLTVARFYGVTARVKSSNYVEYGEAKGFEATAEALLVASDQVISQADAMCLNDEENWSTRKKYEWRKDRATGKAHKVVTGETPVPLFQLKSMAQTRACAKALRNVLAWVVVLAGYAPTPAEEMGELIEAQNTTGSTEAQHAVLEEKLKAIAEEKKNSPAVTGAMISEPQRKRMYAIWKGSGWSDEEAHLFLKGKYGIEHTKDVPKALYEEICKTFESGTQPNTKEELPF